MKRPRIAPSILASDFANLSKGVKMMEEAGAEMLHLDVMDGHFVPNLTIGPPVIEALRKVTHLELDVHLMISNPEDTLEAYLDAGPDFVSVHYEAARHLDLMLSQIREKGVKAGVVLNPHSPVLLLEEVLPKCDFVLLMSVNPGFGGQEFISTTFKKVRKLRRLIRNLGTPDIQIEIDGGISLHNAAEAVESGVDIVVTGTGVFGSKDPIARFQELKRIAEGAVLGEKQAF